MPLSTPQLHALQQRLTSRRDALVGRLRAGIGRLRERDVEDAAGPAVDAGDESVADLLAHLGRAEVAREVGELHELEAALERIATRCYGACADCGEQIDDGRLAALPTAQRCIPCQSQREKTFAHRDPPRL